MERWEQALLKRTKAKSRAKRQRGCRERGLRSVSSAQDARPRSPGIAALPWPWWVFASVLASFGCYCLFFFFF